MPHQSALVKVSAASAGAQTASLEVGEVPRQSEEDQERLGPVEDAGVPYQSAEEAELDQDAKARKRSDDRLVRGIFYFYFYFRKCW